MRSRCFTVLNTIPRQHKVLTDIQEFQYNCMLMIWNDNSSFISNTSYFLPVKWNFNGSIFEFRCEKLVQRSDGVLNKHFSKICSAQTRSFSKCSLSKILESFLILDTYYLEKINRRIIKLCKHRNFQVICASRYN